MKHTSGPWMEWDEDTDEIDILRDGDGPESERTVATVRSCREVQANARLIAAAPELLEACQAVLTGLEEGHFKILGTEHSPFPIQKLRDAIANATRE